MDDNGEATGTTQLDVLVDAFAEGFRANRPPSPGALGAADLAEIGRQAGEAAAAAATWRERLGDTLDTETVVRLLGVTRQALDSRKRTGSVVALPGSGTSHYPAWQFDTSGPRPVVRDIMLGIVTAFRERLDDPSPFTIAAWATSPQPELEDRTPADWVLAGGADEPVVAAARRAAHLETR